MDNQAPNDNGITLLKKGKKGLAHMVFSRFGIVLLLLVVQIVLLLALFFRFQQLTPHYLWLSTLFNATMIIVLVNSRHDASSKITWLIVMMLFPVFGGLLYLYTSTEVGHKALKRRVSRLTQETRGAIAQDSNAIHRAEAESPELADLAHYVSSTGCFPVFENTNVTYFPIGEKMFSSILEELEKAEQFIFLEYFILDEGFMWGQILEILIRKAKAGVDVRVMYDGTCEFTLLPRDYPKRLEALGISCRVFAPITPFVSTHYNYRDHRKILVVDGRVAFTGGINLADEYINKIVRFGHWKDTGLKLCGDAVASFTLMFLQMWHVKDNCMGDVAPYLSSPPLEGCRGFVMPYGDCPLDGYDVGESIYMDILNRAHNYVYIMTPYLILDGELEKSLTFAAQRGVDVRLILPHICDHFVANALAKTYYRPLTEAGVKLYEYTPGFVHAKVFVSDDLRAVVGTINLDYRSLYHHFECAAYLHGVDCIEQIKEDFLSTQEKSQAVTPHTIQNEKWFVKLIGNVAKIIAPLL